MREFAFCIIIGMVTFGCAVNAQTNSQKRDLRCWDSSNNVIECPKNLPSNSLKSDKIVKAPSEKNPASQKRLYQVCGNPKSKCDAPDLYDDAAELPIQIPGNLKWFGRYKSKPFYAVIVSSRKVIPEGHPADEDAQDCGGDFSRDERDVLQNLFPNNKVFSTAFGCYYGQHEYTNVNYDYNFMAIYAGTRAEARTLLTRITKLKTYPGSNIRKMQAILCYGCH